MDRKGKAKLSLKRETLRKLDDRYLARVAGGTATILTTTDVIDLEAYAAYLGRIGTTVSVIQCTTR